MKVLVLIAVAAIAVPYRLCSGWLSPFNVFTDLQTFDDAISACESVGTSLVVIENAHVQEALECLLSKRQLNGNNPYINVYKSNGEFTTADGEPLTFSNWADGEPKGYGNCGAIRGAGDHKWEDGPCDRKRMYICDGKVNDLTQADKDRFHVYTDKLTFDEAVAACECKGATLAVVKNPLVQDYLSNYLYENGLSPENPYINVYKSNGQFTTVDGEPLTYTNWADSEPSGNGNCGNMWGWKSNAWDDGPCDRERMYICEDKVGSVTSE